MHPHRYGLIQTSVKFMKNAVIYNSIRMLVDLLNVNKQM